MIAEKRGDIFWWFIKDFDRTQGDVLAVNGDIYYQLGSRLSIATDETNTTISLGNNKKSDRLWRYGHH